MKNCLLLLFFIMISGLAIAQDTPRAVHRRPDSSLFSDNNIPVRNDYLESFERVFQTLNKAPLLTASFLKLSDIRDQLNENDSTLVILKGRLSLSYRLLNIRNLQVYNTLLDKLDVKTAGYESDLNDYDKKLDDLKKEIAGLRKDTLIRHIFRDSALRASFIPQLQQLHAKWRRADSLMRSNTAEIDNLKAHASANAITIAELLYQTDAALSELASRAFGREQPYLWEPHPDTIEQKMPQVLKKSITGEQKLARYYFANDRNTKFWLWITLALFFYWVWFNFRSLKRTNKLTAVSSFRFRYIKPLPITASLVFMLSLAPLFDPHAPAVYIESTQFLLMLLLSIFFRKQLPRRLFVLWLVFIALSLSLYFNNTLNLPVDIQRWTSLLLNTASAVLGLLFLFGPKTDMPKQRFGSFSAGLYVLLNLLAMTCNLFGRTTLAQIFGVTAVFAFAQSVSLAIFVQTVAEAFLLQIQSSRIRKKYPEQFEAGNISASIYRLTTILACMLWLIAFTTNLNLYDAINDMLVEVFNSPRHVGNFSFTLSGIALFTGIIWVANFLQKYIAYFFGDTGDDAAIDDKGQRSRLLVTRLILLIAGFLLAVAASGLPVDKITFVLGALGVGIGLGLQSIVNNFVSGIIIIFDRPMRIGDTVEIGDKKGRVKEISIRSSTLLTEEGAEVIIPNGEVLSHNIVNWTLSNSQVRVTLSFTLENTAGADTDAIQSDIINLIKSNPNVFVRREPQVIMENITTKSIGIKVYFWCTDINLSNLSSAQVRKAIYLYLENKGFNVI
jgi:small-conductance mechanosensitive channel